MRILVLCAILSLTKKGDYANTFYQYLNWLIGTKLMPIKTPKKSISIFLTTRAEGNDNHALEALVESICECAFNIDAVELLVKYDDDDALAELIVKRISQGRLDIKSISGPRGRGYEDIHLGYTSLLPLADPSSDIYICMADDFICVPNWDLALIKSSINIYGSIYIIHQRPHPPSNRKLLSFRRYFPNFGAIKSEDLYVIDEAPAWSASLIKLLGGFGPISFTDLWTLDIEKALGRSGLCITAFLDNEIISRTLNSDIDVQGTKRWKGARARNFSYAESVEYKAVIDQQAKSISAALKSISVTYLVSRFRFFFDTYCANFYSRILFATRLNRFFSKNYTDDIEVLSDVYSVNIIGYKSLFFIVPQSKGCIDGMYLSSLRNISSSSGSIFDILGSPLIEEATESGRRNAVKIVLIKIKVRLHILWRILTK